MKIEVHKQGGTRKVIQIDEGATKGATVGVNVWNQDGTLFVPFTGDAEPELAITYWSLILEIPLRVVALAQSTGLGLYAITADDTGATREIEVSPRLLIENANGVDGNPFLDIADTVLVANGALSALRVVVAEDGAARYPDIDTVGDALLAIGVTVDAADDATDVRVRTDGELVDASWSWVPGVVWCGADGVLTQSIPATGWLLEVGRVAAPDRIVIDLQTPYIRSV